MKPDGAHPRRDEPHEDHSRRDTSLRRVGREARPFLRARTGVVLRLAGWSLLEFAQTFLGGFGVARALDDGFLAGRP
ncbi:ABC transporter ATP-binding protein, partial [Streptomyces anulatus]